jgi:uncharacterized protein YoxC
MSVLLQICFVIVTVAVAAIAVAVIGMMQHFRKTSDEFSELAREGREVIQQMRGVTQEAGEIIGAFRDVAPSLRAAVSRIETVGDRVASLAEAVVHEVEMPVRTAVAVARGVRFGALDLVGRLTHRFAGRTSTNGGSDPEGA